MIPQSSPILKIIRIFSVLYSDVSKWTGAQLRKLGSLIKGLSKEEILKITKKNFKDMIGSCAHFASLNGDALKALATRAKQVCFFSSANPVEVDLQESFTVGFLYTVS